MLYYHISSNLTPFRLIAQGQGIKIAFKYLVIISWWVQQRKSLFKLLKLNEGRVVEAEETLAEHNSKNWGS